MNETVLITGGTGLIGKALTDMLTQKGYRVHILTRKEKSAIGNVRYYTWDPDNLSLTAEAIATADHIIHLAGAGVADKRWTSKRKKEIASSRINGGKTLVKALKELPNRVRTVVSASAIGWYGPDNKKGSPFVETDPWHQDFLGETCHLWEQSILPVESTGRRLVILRTGIVLSNEGGAFKSFRGPLKAGIAAILGSGKQAISWIHMDDLCRMYLYCMGNEHVRGIYNAVAPEPVTNKTLILKTAKAVNRPYIPVHVPAFVLRVMLGEMSIEVLKSATVDGTKIRNAGFGFLYPSFDAAVNALVRG